MRACAARRTSKGLRCACRAAGEEQRGVGQAAAADRAGCKGSIATLWLPAGWRARCAEAVRCQRRGCGCEGGRRMTGLLSGWRLCAAGAGTGPERQPEAYRVSPGSGTPPPPPYVSSGKLPLSPLLRAARERVQRVQLTQVVVLEHRLHARVLVCGGRRGDTRGRSSRAQPRLARPPRAQSGMRGGVWGPGAGAWRAHPGGS